ncbi:MAG: Do family serine endopeptidase [Rhodospirillaceae bacterium]|nr:Do family serine endopeptidase [Rhodospirillaceae bacterium]
MITNRSISVKSRFANKFSYLVKRIILVCTAITCFSISAHATTAPDSFADLAKLRLPSVVNISTAQTLKNPERGLYFPRFPHGSPFDEFFKNFMDKPPNGGGNSDSNQRRITSLGSGFIIDPLGFLVTNNHVIDAADEITVILQDGQSFRAEIIGRDVKADLALLKINTPNKLQAISFGNSDDIQIGDWVMAIGNPFGMSGSVTAGIISARARDINAGPYDDFLQTDAAINHGNSGGPLLNLKGEVIGINTVIFSPSGGSVGIGFAIPANLAKPIIADLQKYGKARRGWLGVRIQSVNDEIAESLGLKEQCSSLQCGALVAEVDSDSPASKSGIKKGDVILRFDGHDINGTQRLPLVVAETQINKNVEVVFWRNGKKLTTRIIVGEFNDGAEQQEVAIEKIDPKQVSHSNITALGLSVSSLSPSLRERYDLSTEAKGIVVTSVKPSGIAAEKGIREGDLIIEVSQEAVKSPADFAIKIELARKANRKSVLLLIQSEIGTHFVPLKIEPINSKKDNK